VALLVARRTNDRKVAGEAY